mgnify:CR=1 FL=1
MDYGNQGRMNVLDEFGKNTLEPILKEIRLSTLVDTFIYTTVFGTYEHLTLLQPFFFVHRIQRWNLIFYLLITDQCAFQYKVWSKKTLCKTDFKKKGNPSKYRTEKQKKQNQVALRNVCVCVMCMGEYTWVSFKEEQSAPKFV